MDTEKYKESIKKTGFFLEYKIGKALMDKGWSVISNRYYVDDQSGSVREIDLVGYRTAKLKDFTVYTVLLVSCKKNEKNLWALLSRDVNPKDPNVDWQPVHLWTNERVLDYMISKTAWRNSYFQTAMGKADNSILDIPDVDIYAFQELSESSGTVQNDKAIFNSVISLMKAQSYEMARLPDRKTDPVLYQFNLLSIVDSELIRLHFRDDKVNAEIIDHDIFIADYIINKQQTSARIHFVKAAAFPAVLSDYERLHSANCTFFEQLCDHYYENAVRDSSKTDVFKEDFHKRLKWDITFTLKRHYKRDFAVDGIYLSWSEHDGVLVVVDVPEECAEFLNEDKNLRTKTAKALEDLYRYKGEFRFKKCDDIPF